jgi:hypothetical protein
MGWLCFKTKQQPVGIMKRKYKFFRVFVAAFIVIAATSKINICWAQDVAVGSATARVLANITVTALSPLDFGDIFQGVPKAVGNNEAEAAIFSVTGQAGAGITIYLQLPEYLSLSDGSDRLIAVFGSNDVSVGTIGAANPAGMVGASGWQNVNPYNIPAAVVGSVATDIYLGGSVNPSINQKAGNYSGDIIITAAYDGT